MHVGKLGEVGDLGGVGDGVRSMSAGWSRLKEMVEEKVEVTGKSINSTAEEVEVTKGKRKASAIIPNPILAIYPKYRK